MPVSPLTVIGDRLKELKKAREVGSAQMKNLEGQARALSKQLLLIQGGIEEMEMAYKKTLEWANDKPDEEKPNQLKEGKNA